MDLEFLVGIISAIIATIGQFYIWSVFLKLKGSMKYAYTFIALGLVFGYAVIILLVLEDLGRIPELYEHFLIKVFMGFAAVLVGMGASKLLKVFDYIPESFFKTIDKYKHNV